MKTFLFINGTNVYLIEMKDMETAILFAENTFDNSKEIIIREVHYIQNCTKIDIRTENVTTL